MFSRLMSITNHLYWLITTYTGPPIRGRFINVSTIDTGNENKLRPNVSHEEKQYWLKPEKIVFQSMAVIESLQPLWQEIDVYEILPGFTPEEYYNDYQTIKEKWRRQMGLTTVDECFI